MNKNRYTEDDFEGFIDQLYDLGRIDSKQAGIAKYMIDNGYDALSARQKYVFDRMIADNTVDECKACVTDIPWCEMLEALDNGGYCNYCQHMMEKDD